MWQFFFQCKNFKCPFYELGKWRSKLYQELNIFFFISSPGIKEGKIDYTLVWKSHNSSLPVLLLKGAWASEERNDALSAGWKKEHFLSWECNNLVVSWVPWGWLTQSAAGKSNTSALLEGDTFWSDTVHHPGSFWYHEKRKCHCFQLRNSRMSHPFFFKCCLFSFY